MNREPQTPLEALKALVEKLEEIESHPQYKALWTLAVAHGFDYQGPDWEEELQQAKNLLADWEETQP